MRSFIVYLFILLVSLPSANPEQPRDHHEIIDLADAFDASELHVSEWEVTIKEQVEQNDALDIIDKLNHPLNGQETKDKDRKKWHAKESFQSENMYVDYTVIVPDEPHHQSEIVATISGNTWDEANAEAYIQKERELKQTMFTERSKRFSCLTAGIHDIMLDVNFLDKLQENLDAKTISKQEDTVEDSMINEITYGYTPLWKEDITIDETPVNLQMVVKRTDEGRLTVTAGTPILINEY